MALNSLSHKYNRKDVLYDLSSFFANFTQQERVVNVDKKKYEYIDTAYYLGKNKLFSIFEIHHHHISDARVGLTKQAVEIMKSRRDFTQRAIFFFVPKYSNTFRISLVTFDWANNKPNNPRRYSFLVGEGQKVHTAIKQLSNPVTNEEDLLKRFSIEVVNDTFYGEISKHFNELIKNVKHPTGVNDTEEGFKRLQNFSVRLIGRLVFCWFLKKKYRNNGTSLISDDLISSKAVKNCKGNYYHDILEPLFFETLNKECKDRIKKCKEGEYKDIPFLNGGLFNPDSDDRYELNDLYISKNYNTLKIENSWFESLFNVFELYNFTIDENTSTDIDLAVDPEMLGRIFENLLASINPETKESVRKATGSYYTPREVVDYMVTQSLKQYLYTKTDIDHTVIDSLFEFEPKVDKLTLTQKQRLYTVLSEIKVLDPAVGSGAFPMGILQKIMSIIHIIDETGDIYRSLPESNINISQNLTSKTLDYANKLTLIQKCIYGVDIQPMAIEICRLRFFLTLIVEEEADNPQALPNLNFNFTCANSLIGLDNNNTLELKQKRQSIIEEIERKKNHSLLKDRNIWNFSKEQKNQVKAITKEISKLEKEKDILSKQIEETNVNSFLNGEDYIAQLRAYRKEFFAASGTRKETLKKKFIDTQYAMLEALQANDWGNEKIIKLQLWKPFDNLSTEWFDPVWMFDVEDGFDIVIGNPPYIKEKGNKEVFQAVKKKSNFLSCFYQGKMDLFYFFFHLALNLLKNKGICTFITTNYYITATNATKLRTDFKQRACMLKLINFNEFKIFKSALGQHNIITLLQKTNIPSPKTICRTCITSRKGNAKYNDLNLIISWNDKETSYYSVPQSDLYETEQNYMRLTNDDNRPLNRILYKIKENHQLLGNICHINQGIVSGADSISNKHIKKYNIEAQKGDGIFVLDSNNIRDYKVIIKIQNNQDKELLVPFFKNSDISRFYTNNSCNKYILYLDKQKTDIANYNTINCHLQYFKKIIDVSSHNSPYLHRPRKQDIFTSSKIVVPQRSTTNTFGYNETEWYASADVYFITAPINNYKLKYILALLNSKLYYVWLYNKGKRKGDNLELYQTPLSEIPIKKIGIDIQQQFVAVVDKILAITQTKDYLSNSDKQSRVKAYQDGIDQMVYKLYGLTEEEIKIVEESQPKKKS